MIAFVDPFNRGLSHVPVNVGIIETALLASHKEEMVITADSAHLDGLLDLLDPSLRNRIGSTVPLDLPEPGVRFVRRLRGDFANLAKVFGFSPGGAVGGKTNAVSTGYFNGRTRHPHRRPTPIHTCA